MPDPDDRDGPLARPTSFSLYIVDSLPVASEATAI